MNDSVWGSPIEVERKRRIDVSVWAYAYEIEDSPLVDDQTFDRESALIDVSIETGRKNLDLFFKKHFSPYTGMWIRLHPELIKIRYIVNLRRSNSRI